MVKSKADQPVDKTPPDHDELMEWEAAKAGKIKQGIK